MANHHIPRPPFVVYVSFLFFSIVLFCLFFFSFSFCVFVFICVFVVFCCFVFKHCFYLNYNDFQLRLNGAAVRHQASTCPPIRPLASVYRTLFLVPENKKCQITFKGGKPPHLQKMFSCCFCVSKSWGFEFNAFSSFSLTLKAIGVKMSKHY